MQLTKYKLGDLIAQRREKNKDYDLPIRGVSREGFIKPKVEEADTSIYNVFYKNDFVFNPARMELNSIALNLDLDKALCSSLYEVFYVKDENVVLPEFLNLHIKRDEFARHCDYIGLGSAREYCRFANIAEFDIKIPPIEVQREIVQADRQIKSRIRLNEQMIEKLEATAQALYRKMFVDGIDKENLPEGWRMGFLGEIITPRKGKNIVREDCINGDVPVIAGGKAPSCYHNQSNTACPVITISASGANAGYISLHFEKVWAGDCSFIDIIMCPYLYYIYVFLSLNQDLIYGMQEGTGQPHIYPQHIMSLKTIIPPTDDMIKYHNHISSILIIKKYRQLENSKLSELQSLLLARMGNMKQ